ncbi:pantetheine-phosphate adenylyltransferase [Helicobacter monodelphidis]|uniref:pantetheine-phosphate adenylyltransferase n=1 Tax=Helicobacter sp. 15-1451 TaxID=2004995 RepID=UPI000DCE5034|nr:pantetheine-phosphate adenylyltransferase [Helicobacter sp. 15-1451]RAX58656.1 pantetheine-phosphate adenylyltransferase [Helicobacter sp. 15-1451]
MYRKAIYPGTFDPITNGHLDIIRRASSIFQEVIVAVAESASKSPMFSLQERKEMIEIALKHMDGNISVQSFDCLLANFAKQNGVVVLVRGLRAVSDFEYELQIGYANASLNKDLETVYFMPSLENAFISSSVVRSILTHQGKICHLVPFEVCRYLQEKGYVCSA